MYVATDRAGTATVADATYRPVRTIVAPPRPTGSPCPQRTADPRDRHVLSAHHGV